MLFLDAKIHIGTRGLSKLSLLLVAGRQIAINEKNYRLHNFVFVRLQRRTLVAHFSVAQPSKHNAQKVKSNQTKPHIIIFICILHEKTGFRVCFRQNLLLKCEALSAENEDAIVRKDKYRNRDTQLIKHLYHHTHTHTQCVFSKHF